MVPLKKSTLPLLGGVLLTLTFIYITGKVKEDCQTSDVAKIELPIVAIAESNSSQSKEVPTLHKEVKLPGTHIHHQDLRGAVFDVSGISKNLTSNVTTELVYSFSPSSEELFASKIVDPMHQQKVLANSPAMVWYKNKFIVILRMWLDKEETKKLTQNIFSDNYFYKRVFSDQMEPLDGSGKVMGMPTRVHLDIGDGPIEPRAFPFYSKLYLSFNTAVSVSKKLVDTTMFWDFNADKFIMPEISDGQPQLGQKRSMPRDKHWSPYTYQDELYMVYSLDPLRIVKCNNESKCSFTQNAGGGNYTFRDGFDCLRGGTPTLQYRDNYYISIAHSTLFRKDQKYKRYYTINLVVLKAGNPEHQIIYLSEPIRFDTEVMSRVPIIRREWIMDPFFFPVTLLLENEDSVIIGGHINDHSSYLFRLTGLSRLMEDVIRSGETLSTKRPANGFLHNLSRGFAAAQSGIQFEN